MLVYGNPIYICDSTVPFIPLKDDSLGVNAVAVLWCVVQPYGCWGLGLVAGLCSFGWQGMEALERQQSRCRGKEQLAGGDATFGQHPESAHGLCKSCLQPSPAGDMALVSGLKGRKK